MKNSYPYSEVFSLAQPGDLLICEMHRRPWQHLEENPMYWNDKEHVVKKTFLLFSPATYNPKNAYAKSYSVASGERSKEEHISIMAQHIGFDKGEHHYEFLLTANWRYSIIRRGNKK